MNTAKRAPGMIEVTNHITGKTSILAPRKFKELFRSTENVPPHITAVVIAQAVPEHTHDSQCTIDSVTDSCTVCGVYHGEPCPECHGRGFHLPTCPTQQES